MCFASGGEDSSGEGSPAKRAKPLAAAVATSFSFDINECELICFLMCPLLGLA
jgi:hypothetical protein